MQYRQKSQSHYYMRLTFFNSGCNFKFSHRKFTIPREEASKTAAPKSDVFTDQSRYTDDRLYSLQRKI